MGLTPDQIAKLLAMPEKKPRGKKAAIDFATIESRSYENWFKLAHKIFDEETGESPKCGNPECIDTRTHGQLVVEILDTQMCRICFMDGYALATTDLSV